MTGIDFEYIRWARQAAEADHYLELMALFARQYHGAMTQAEHYRKEGDAAMEAMMQFWVGRSLEQHDQCKLLHEKQTGKATEAPDFLSPAHSFPSPKRSKRRAKRCPADFPKPRLERLAQGVNAVRSGG